MRHFAALVAVLGVLGVWPAAGATPPGASIPKAKKKGSASPKAARHSRSASGSVGAPGEVYAATEGPDDGEAEVLPAQPIRHSVATVKLQPAPARASVQSLESLSEGSLAPEYAETKEEAPLPPPADPVPAQAKAAAQAKGSAMAQAGRGAAPTFDSVPEKEVSSLRRRLSLVDKLLQEFGRAYDYRVVSVRELERIYAALKTEKQPSPAEISPAPEAAPESASRAAEGPAEVAASG